MISGTMGVGKSSVSRELLKLLPRYTDAKNRS